MSSTRKVSAALLLLSIAVTGVRAQDPSYTDPPGRVGRVSFMAGTVSLYPSAGADWTAASLNYPLTSGDALWADAGGRAEVHLGSSAIRMAAQTSITFGEVSDTVTQVRLDQGTIDVHVRFLNDNEIYEIDTPGGVVSLVDEGHYRIDVAADGHRTTVTVRDGDAAIERGDGGQPADVRAGSSAVLGAAGTVVAAPPVGVDDWERWADGRDEREDAVQSTQYVSRDMVGYEDLDQYGGWSVDASLGNVWYPSAVPAGWAPYRYGHWSSVGPWGWTWIDDAPWGFAPFHYGRWAYVRNRWGWVPGSIQLRPVYAPALVAFVGGSGWGASVSAGGQPVGWVPLGPGEEYTPGYRASTRYLHRINFVARSGPAQPARRPGEFQYVNRNAPGAFTAVPRDVFERSRPVPQATIALRPADIVAARPATPPPPAARGGGPARGDDRARGGEAPHPPAPAGGNRVVAPTPPPTPWRGRPMPQQQATNGATPSRPNDRGDRGAGGRGGPPAGAPAQPPVTPPVTPPPANGAPPVRPPPRPSGPPGQQPPPAPAQVAQPATPAPGTLPPGRPAMRPTQPTPLENSPEWQRQRAELAQRQQQEAADLTRQRAAQQGRGAPPGTPPNQAQQQQQQQQQQQAAAQKALIDRQQQQRDQVDKQFRKPADQVRPPPPPPPPPPAPAGQKPRPEPAKKPVPPPDKP